MINPVLRGAEDHQAQCSSDPGHQSVQYDFDETRFEGLRERSIGGRPRSCSRMQTSVIAASALISHRHIELLFVFQVRSICGPSLDEDDFELVLEVVAAVTDPHYPPPFLIKVISRADSKVTAG